MDGWSKKRASNKQSLVPILSLSLSVSSLTSHYLPPSPYLSCSLSLPLSTLFGHAPSARSYPRRRRLRLRRPRDHYRRMSYQNRSGQNGQEREREREREGGREGERVEGARRGRGTTTTTKKTTSPKPERMNERTSEIPREKSERKEGAAQLRRWVYSRKKRPLSVRNPVHHLAGEGLLNFLHNEPSSGRFDKLTNPVDACQESCRQRANFDCIPNG